MDSTNMTTVSTGYSASTPVQPNTNKVDVEKLQSAVDTLRKYIYQHSKDLVQEESVNITETQVSNTPEIQLADQPVMQNDTLVEETTLTYNAGVQPTVATTPEQSMSQESPVVLETPVIPEVQPVPTTPVIETPVAPVATIAATEPVVEPIVPPVETVQPMNPVQPIAQEQTVSQTVEVVEPRIPVVDPVPTSATAANIGLENPQNAPVNNTTENELTLSELDSLIESADSVETNLISQPISEAQPPQPPVVEANNSYSIPEVMPVPPLESVVPNAEPGPTDTGYIATSNSAAATPSNAPVPANNIPVIMPDGHSAATPQSVESMVTTPQSFGMV